MSKSKKFDVIVIGSGAAGFSAVEAARGVGASVCVIEKEKLGGECPNFACVPAKAVLKAAKVYREAQQARNFGVNVGAVSYDFQKVMNYRDKVVETITGGGDVGDRYLKIFKKLKIAVELGEAKFIDDHTVEVNGKQLSAKAIVVTTGTEDFIPPIKGLAEISHLTWKKALMQKRQPKSLSIIGGGPVGCEIACFYASFGTRVIIFQGASNVLNREDQEVSKLAQKSLEKLGIEIINNAKINEVVDGHGVFGVRLENVKDAYATEQLLVAAGKRSNTKGFNLEATGVALNDRGSIKTTKQQATSVRHIFAAGDVDGGMMFTHTAHNEGYIAGHNAALLAKRKRSKKLERNEKVVPRVTFIESEVASVGMTAQEAKKAFKKVLVGRYNMSALSRAVTDSRRFGLIKLVAHPKTRKLVGGHIIGENAGEMIHEIAMAIHLNATIDKVANMIHAFPTYSEGIAPAALSAELE